MVKGAVCQKPKSYVHLEARWSKFIHSDQMKVCAPKSEIYLSGAAWSRLM